MAAPPALTRATLRDAITEALYPISAYELADICVAFGLAAKGPDEDDPFLSKRGYIKRRVNTMSRDDLLDLARNVHEEYPTDELAVLVGSPATAVLTAR